MLQLSRGRRKRLLDGSSHQYGSTKEMKQEYFLLNQGQSPRNYLGESALHSSTQWATIDAPNWYGSFDRRASSARNRTGVVPNRSGLSLASLKKGGFHATVPSLGWCGSPVDAELHGHGHSWYESLGANRPHARPRSVNRQPKLPVWKHVEHLHVRLSAKLDRDHRNAQDLQVQTSPHQQRGSRCHR